MCCSSKYKFPKPNPQMGIANSEEGLKGHFYEA